MKWNKLEPGCYASECKAWTIMRDTVRFGSWVLKVWRLRRVGSGLPPTDHDTLAKAKAAAEAATTEAKP